MQWNNARSGFEKILQIKCVATYIFQICYVVYGDNDFSNNAFGVTEAAELINNKIKTTLEFRCIIAYKLCYMQLYILWNLLLSYCFSSNQTEIISYLQYYFVNLHQPKRSIRDFSYAPKNEPIETQSVTRYPPCHRNHRLHRHPNPCAHVHRSRKALFQPHYGADGFLLRQWKLGYAHFPDSWYFLG